NRAVLEEAMAKYNATKEVIAEEVQKEYRKEIEEYEKEKAKFSESIKEKDNNIAKLKNDLEVAKLNVEGKQAEVQALRNHVNDMKTIYNETINKYSDPTLIMAPLIVANEYLGNVIMLAKEHRWYEKTLKETKQYIAKIKNNLDRVITEMEINLVTDEINKMADDADKIAESAKKAYLEAARKKDNNDTTQEYDNVINFNK
ncbi:MAG TPA: hypothetical protein PK661_09655, partial [Syntrophorhabdaceae bacterium]|nr:hypothetical protein [Syntrophorhabdaceae bacterium]